MLCMLVANVMMYNISFCADAQGGKVSCSTVDNGNLLFHNQLFCKPRW